jgi:hypothetical protein
MLYLFVFLGGVVIGIIISKIGVRRSSAYGAFRLEPYDEDNTGFYNVHIILNPNQGLLHKKYIILTKDDSQK